MKHVGYVEHNIATECIMKKLSVALFFLLSLNLAHASDIALCMGDDGVVVNCVDDHIPNGGQVNFASPGVYTAGQLHSVYLTGGTSTNVSDHYVIYVDGQPGCQTQIAFVTPIWNCSLTINTPGQHWLSAVGANGTLPHVNPIGIIVGP
jgi:hypothetical protein